MEAEEILTRVRSGEDVPENWVIFPLLRKKVLLGVAGWVIGAFMGLALLAMFIPIVIPSNYLRGVGAAIFTTLLLGILLFVGVGSLWLLVSDLRRVQQADKHVIVITNENFVKQEGEKIISVPLNSILHVTPRGRAPADPMPAATDTRPTSSIAMLGGIFGGGRGAGASRGRRRGMRSPTSLAFIDSRVGREVTVVNDTSYGDPFTIASLLKEYANSSRPGSGPEQIEQKR